jgi:hypothetical protein
MKLDSKELTKKDSPHLGKIFWICDYRQPDLDKKAIRHVQPTPVVLVSESELPKGKRVFGSYNFFKKLNNKGAIVDGSIIPICDNTGSTVPVSIFDNESECRNHYAAMADAIIDSLDNRMATILQRLQSYKEDVIANKLKGMGF